MGPAIPAVTSEDSTTRMCEETGRWTPDASLTGTCPLGSASPFHTWASQSLPRAPSSSRDTMHVTQSGSRCPHSPPGKVPGLLQPPQLCRQRALRASPPAAVKLGLQVRPPQLMGENGHRQVSPPPPTKKIGKPRVMLAICVGNVCPQADTPRACLPLIKCFITTRTASHLRSKAAP